MIFLQAMVRTTFHNVHRESAFRYGYRLSFPFFIHLISLPIMRTVLNPALLPLPGFRGPCLWFAACNLFVFLGKYGPFMQSRISVGFIYVIYGISKNISY